MKKILFIFTFIFLLCTQSIAKQNRQSLDQMIAIVNEDIITKSELNHAIMATKIQINQEHLTLPAEKELQKQMLDQLINKKLQLQIAKQVGIVISDNDLNNTIKHIAEQNNISVAVLYQRINQEGMSTANYRNELRDQLTLQKLQQQEVISHITVSPSEIDTYLRSKSWQQEGTKEYHLDDILLPLSNTPSPDEIAATKKQADAVLIKLKQGHSINDIAPQRNDLGWRKLEEIPSAFSEQVTHLASNEMAGPIQTSNGFHIIHLLAVRVMSSHQPAPDRKHVEELLLQKKFEEAVKIWISKLRSQAFIEMNPKN